MTEEGTEETPPPHWLESPRNIVLFVLVQGIAFSGAGLAIWYATGRDPALFLRWHAADLLVALLLAGALVGSMHAVARAFPRFVGWAADKQRHFFPSGRRYRPTQIVLISAAAGIGEEALFRGGLQTLLGDHLPAWAAILVASLLFVVAHLGSLGTLAFVFAYSLMFGLVYHQTGSLAAVMLAHAAFDVWAIMVVQRDLIRRGVLDG